MDRSIRVALRVAVPAGLLASAVLVWHSTEAAFTANTTNPGNSFTAGTVTLADDDSGTALFSVTGLKPGSTGQACVKVNYNGSLAAAVKLFVAPGDLIDSSLAAYLNLTVEEGSGGSSASCAGFAASATDYSGTLAGFAAASTNSATGVSTFTPSAAGQSRVYRFTYTLADNNAAQGGSAQATFSWEAAST